MWSEQDVVALAVGRHQLDVVPQCRILQHHHRQHKIAAQHIPISRAHFTDSRWRSGRERLVTPVDLLVKHAVEIDGRGAYRHVTTVLHRLSCLTPLSLALSPKGEGDFVKLW